jgi:hypothetical protein
VCDLGGGRGFGGGFRSGRSVGPPFARCLALHAAHREHQLFEGRKMHQCTVPKARYRKLSRMRFQILDGPNPLIAQAVATVMVRGLWVVAEPVLGVVEVLRRSSSPRLVLIIDIGYLIVWCVARRCRKAGVLSLGVGT